MFHPTSICFVLVCIFLYEQRVKMMQHARRRHADRALVSLQFMTMATPVTAPRRKPSLHPLPIPPPHNSKVPPAILGLTAAVISKEPEKDIFHPPRAASHGLCGCGARWRGRGRSGAAGPLLRPF